MYLMIYVVTSVTIEHRPDNGIKATTDPLFSLCCVVALAYVRSVGIDVNPLVGIGLKSELRGECNTVHTLCSVVAFAYSCSSAVGLWDTNPGDQLIADGQCDTPC